MLSFWDSEQVFLDGDEYFDSLIKDIDEAKSYITIEMYIFNNDSLGKKIAAHLIGAQQRGVKIQIIVDGVGSYQFFDKLHDVFLKKGIMVKIYNPLPFIHPYYGNLKPWKKFQIFMLRVWRMNKRNHRKIITIDEEVMYVGSYNFTIEHIKTYQHKPWKDMGVRVTGGKVKHAVLGFKRSWKLRDYYRYRRQLRKMPPLNWKQSPLRLNQSLFMKAYFFKDFLNRVKQANQRVWLMTPYFIPKRRLIRTLGKAAKRGVDVRILISMETDVKIFRTLQYFYFAYLIKKGVKVFQYTETVLHAKNYLIDDWTTVGSSNLNHRSFLHDLEVDLVIQDQPNLAIIERNYLDSTNTLKMITEQNLKQRPLVDRLLSRLFFLFKYWF